MDFSSFVLAASTPDLADEPAAHPHADAIEFRLDLGEAPAEQLAAYDGELPVLATNRVTTEGGQAPDEPARVDDLVAAVAQPSVQAVDIELAALTAGGADRIVDAARERDVAVVVSSHDFDGTPTREAMTRTLRRAAETGDVAKLAVTATDPGDVLDLLEVTWALTGEGVDVATMAMGDAGRHSRAVAPVFGSRIGYAPVDLEGPTAPGQYDLETLRTLVDHLAPPG